MQPVTELWNRFEVFLTTGIAGSEFTPRRLLTVIALMLALVWVTRRVTHGPSIACWRTAASR